jgi:hypothetical protein
MTANVVFKGDNSTISLLEEDNGWGKPPSTYAGAKYFQNNDGTFNATRNALESEARTPNSQLAGVRLGNSNVAGSFPVEVDPENYNKLFESLLYSEFTTAGAAQTLTAVSVTGTLYSVTIPLTSVEQTALGAKVGNIYRLSGISAAAIQGLVGVVVLTGVTGTTATFMSPLQKLATLAATPTDVTINPVSTLRPAKTLKSFNAEETLFAEDGTTVARFMTAGAVVSGASFDLPSEGTVKTTFSLLGAGKRASAEYEDFDPTLVNSTAAHASPTAHVKYDPLVLQDGAIISNSTDTRCIWVSGSLGIENGTSTFFTGCSYEAAGAISAKLRINLDYEALFQSEQDYINFQNENSAKIMLQLKDKATDKSLVLYLPSFKATGYTLNNATGLVTASITGSAIVDTASVDSFIMASYLV